MSKKINRVKKKARNHSLPFFDSPKPLLHKDLQPKEPETPMDIARYLSDEIKKKWPNAIIPDQLSGKHQSQLKMMLQEYTPQNIREMIRLLVWDFETIKNDKAFFPPSSHLEYPWLDQLYNYRFSLAPSIGKGITNGTSRISLYNQRYIQQVQAQSQSTSDPQSAKEIAKKLLGR